MSNVLPVAEQVDASAGRCVEPQHSYEVVEARDGDKEAVVAILKNLEGHLGTRA